MMPGIYLYIRKRAASNPKFMCSFNTSKGIFQFISSFIMYIESFADWSNRKRWDLL
uniref:Uncharacterized protein n=1 Tax=Rhizophora mucronata TaxID=61149 RepID=A0A2P2PLU2_RHIMU